MAIDVHAHYVPRSLVERAKREGTRLGISVVETSPACQRLRFEYGLEVRPFFAKLVEEPNERIASMDKVGITRPILSTWMDVLGHGLAAEPAAAWHRLLNETLAELSLRHPDRFSWLASGPLPYDAAAARELEYR